MPTDVTIYHNPKCGTSRKTLDLLRAEGVEPSIVEYLKTPPSKSVLEDLARRAPGGVRGLLRTKEALCAELGLDEDSVSDKRIVAAMVEHPVLLNRPIVVSRKGVRLCRPPEVALELLGK